MNICLFTRYGEDILRHLSVTMLPTEMIQYSAVERAYISDTSHLSLNSSSGIAYT